MAAAAAKSAVISLGNMFGGLISGGINASSTGAGVVTGVVAQWRQ